MASRHSDVNGLSSTVDQPSAAPTRIIDPPTDSQHLLVLGVVSHFHSIEDTCNGGGPIAGVDSATDWLRQQTNFDEPRQKVESYVGQSMTVVRDTDSDRPTVGVNAPETVLDDPDPTGITEAAQLIHEHYCDGNLEVTDDGVIDSQPLIESHSSEYLNDRRMYVRRALCRYTWVEAPDGHTFDGDDYGHLFRQLSDLHIGESDTVMNELYQYVNSPFHISLTPDLLDSEIDVDNIVQGRDPLQLEGVEYDVESLSPTNVRYEGPYAVFFYRAGINYAMDEIRNILSQEYSDYRDHEQSE